jgi:serine/threonine protein kinase
LPRQVALKFLPPEYTKDKTLKERFFREARATAALEHPNIITIFEAREFEGQPYIAMQYIKGPTIGELIEQRGKIGIGESVSIITKVLDTLEDTHQNGISHRDIKPSNIMLKDGKFVRVIDFGIAKAQTDPQLTAVGTAFGTPAYMAPEQFSARPDANNTLFDIYAVGATFYYMLCGKLPFEGDNPYQIRDDKMSKIPTKPSELCPGISNELDRVILKSLAKNPEERYQSAKEMQNAIEDLIGSDPTIVIRASDDEATVILDAPPEKSSPKKLLFGIVGTVAPLAVVFYFASCPLLGINCSTNEPVQPAETTIATLVAPILSSPADGDVLTSANLTFNWSAISGADIRYTLEYDTDTSFRQPTRIENIYNSSFALAEGLANGQYSWRIQAQDGQGGMSDFSQASVFTINVKSDTSPEKQTKDTVIAVASDKEKISARINPNAPMVEIVVASIPPLALIYVDGQLQQDKQTPKTLSIRAGEHDIKVRWAEIDEEMNKIINIRPGADNRIVFDYQNDTIMVQ